MKLIKVLGVLVLVYVAVVVLFESLLGYFQPANAQTIVIATQDESGAWNERVLARIEVDGTLYAAANHWPRAWYQQALDRPEVEVTADGLSGRYRAVPLTGEAFDRVNGARPLPLSFKILTGFPPRRLLRLEPLAEAG